MMITATQRKHLEYVRANDGWISHAYLRLHKGALEDLVRLGCLKIVGGNRTMLTTAGAQALGPPAAKQAELAL